uniref:RING-type E3 ubiquitin transferase n=1 Tax=Wollemia nobilis TaxID=56998 RepID=A0A0C9RPB0_9CONI
MGTMDAAVEQSLSTAKLHGAMSRNLAKVVYKLMRIFPSVEAARPRCQSGIQALCALHLALEKAKTLLQHCADCSTLYLAITGDSILTKFEKSKNALDQSLRRVESIVPQILAQQIAEIVNELEGITFALEPSEKEVGDEVIALLQKDKDSSCGNGTSELDAFHRVAVKLGIVSSRAVLIEKRALKRLLDKAHQDGDKRKESIIIYLLHLLRKYTKFFKNEYSDGADSPNSAPCSPSIRNSLEGFSGNGRGSDRRGLRAHTSNISRKEAPASSGGMVVPPEEFRCPISLQLMSDPVIISSGQTYERICIEKWFSEGHDTCPKTQQKLAHLCVTPNYCVKGLIASWCEQNRMKLPDPPTASPPLAEWRWDLADSGSIKSVDGSRLKEVKVVPLEDNQISSTFEDDTGGFSTGTLSSYYCDSPMLRNEGSSEIEDGNISWPHEIVESQIVEEDPCKKYERLFAELSGPSLELQCRAAEEIRVLSKDDAEARSYMGANGFIHALVNFLHSAIGASNTKAQETGALALFNISVNNNRNKAAILAAGTVPLLLDILDSETSEAAVALLLMLSSWEDNKASIGSSRAIPVLIKLLDSESNQCRQDAINALYNLSTYEGNRCHMVSAGAISKFDSLLGCGEADCTEKCITILYNLASIEEGRAVIAATEGCIGAIAYLLDTGTPIEQEQAAAILLLLCTNSFECSQMVLNEGVIPSLVTLSVSGGPRGREKAEKLLRHFRDQRQQEFSCQTSQVVCTSQPSNNVENPKEKKTNQKTASKKIGRSLSFLWKSKSFYQC